jgi:hypothetical protein
MVLAIRILLTLCVTVTGWGPKRTFFGLFLFSCLITVVVILMKFTLNQKNSWKSTVYRKGGHRICVWGREEGEAATLLSPHPIFHLPSGSRKESHVVRPHGKWSEGESSAWGDWQTPGSLLWAKPRPTERPHLTLSTPIPSPVLFNRCL